MLRDEIMQDSIKSEHIEKIETTVCNLYPELKPGEKINYRNREWIIFNHIFPAIRIAKSLCNKYGGDFSLCKTALLLHDTGLVYTDKDSAEGHEARSILFAEKILKELNISKNNSEKIIACINATHPESVPTNINEKIVRSADALSQFNTVHFFAKAHFYNELDYYFNWLNNKITKNYEKICFEEEKQELIPIINHYKKIINEYYQKS